MVTFAPAIAPRGHRVALAIQEMKNRVGASRPPTPELFAELAARYDVARYDLEQAWIKVGLS